MSQKRKRSPELGTESNQSSIFRSSPIEDRSSTFIGYFSPSLKPKELQRLEEIASASHKVLGWRRESNQQSITGNTKFVVDHDDDGEKYAGKKIERVLENMQVIGSCVVARWYGGVLLGPVRFEHIENCAKQAVQQWQDSVAEEKSKKRKAEDDKNAKVKLVKTLADRDESIVVLRVLATEKEGKVNQMKTPNDRPNQGSPKGNGEFSQHAEKVSNGMKPTIDYASMSLERLKALEKARDATLSFLLKRIDNAEGELAKHEQEN